ncbi:hypothetical protein [Pectobacterium sp. CFBP8739]|uniref:hypothetical protein n=1 Tax=Pectobacterium sp. CFBP8739 TaxID=2748908 RepID=UPI0015DE5DB5|nr:hypothetical protein [Pectobacterium sp. CFBP8739]MBA0167488.1 hypothetical protein [Pectobacterium sp. CFBP8739]
MLSRHSDQFINAAATSCVTTDIASPGQTVTAALNGVTYAGMSMQQVIGRVLSQ